MLEVRNLAINFKVGSGLLTRQRLLKAVQQMDFTVAAGETFAVVGESGSGKSTLARAVMRLVEPANGSVHLDGEDLTALSGAKLRRVRPNLQMVFQDPYASLDPSKLIRDIVGEPLAVHGRAHGAELEAEVLRLLRLVGLDAHHMARYPHEFSGGQRQRVAIARAIALRPKLLVLDEAVSALDVSTQNQILNLLEDLQREFGMAYLFISHDLGVVRHIADRVAVTYLGRIVEQGPTTRIFEAPAHPYTRALLAAVPVPDPKRQRANREPPLSGEIPSPLDPPSGCAFHGRCPYAQPLCREQIPEHEQVTDGGSVACHVRPQ